MSGFAEKKEAARAWGHAVVDKLIDDEEVLPIVVLSGKVIEGGRMVNGPAAAPTSFSAVDIRHVLEAAFQAVDDEKAQTKQFAYREGVRGGRQCANCLTSPLPPEPLSLIVRGPGRYADGVFKEFCDVGCASEFLRFEARQTLPLIPEAFCP